VSDTLDFTPVTQARAALARAEKALIEIRSRRDQIKGELERVTLAIETAEAERRAALLSGTPLPSGSKDTLGNLKAEWEGWQDAAGELADREAAAVAGILAAESELDDALYLAHGQRMDEARKALIAAIEQHVPALRSAAFETDRGWPTVSHLLASVARDVDWTLPAPPMPKALTGPRRSALLDDATRANG